MSTPNTPNVLIHLAIDGDYVAISTYCRKHGRRGRFLIASDLLSRLLAGSVTTLCDAHCGNYLWAHVSDGAVCITFDWLSEYSDGTLKGFRQHMEAPCAVFTAVMDTGKPIRYLYRPRPAQARINAAPAAKVIREVQRSSITRSALRKALRDNFHWKTDNVTLYRDYGTSFYFETSSGCPVNGGLILHETTVHTPVGMKPKLYYSIHT